MATQSGSIDVKAIKEAHDDAEAKATKYVSSDETGIMIANMASGQQTPSEATGRNVFIDDDSVDIRDGLKKIATFGEETIIGDVNGYRTEIRNDSFKIIDVSDELLDINPTGESQSKTVTNTIFSQATSSTLQYRSTQVVMSYGVSYEIKVNNGNSVTVSASDRQHMPNSQTITVSGCVTTLGFGHVEWDVSGETYVMTVEQESSNTFYKVTRTYTKTSVVPALTFAGDIIDGRGNQVSKSYCYANHAISCDISSKEDPYLVPINAPIYSLGFLHDNTNKGVICNKAGKYMYSVNIPMDTATSGDLIGLMLYKNGSAYSTQYTRMGGNYDCAISMPTMIDLAEGDELTIFLKNNSAARGKSGTSIRLSIWEIG